MSPLTDINLSPFTHSLLVWVLILFLVHLLLRIVTQHEFIPSIITLLLCGVAAHIIIHRDHSPLEGELPHHKKKKRKQKKDHTDFLPFALPEELHTPLRISLDGELKGSPAHQKGTEAFPYQQGDAPHEKASPSLKAQLVATKEKINPKELQNKLVCQPEMQKLIKKLPPIFLLIKALFFSVLVLISILLLNKNNDNFILSLFVKSQPYSPYAPLSRQPTYHFALNPISGIKEITYNYIATRLISDGNGKLVMEDLDLETEIKRNTFAIALNEDHAKNMRKKIYCVIALLSLAFVVIFGVLFYMLYQHFKKTEKKITETHRQKESLWSPPIIKREKDPKGAEEGTQENPQGGVSGDIQEDGSGNEKAEVKKFSYYYYWESFCLGCKQLYEEDQVGGNSFLGSPEAEKRVHQVRKRFVKKYKRLKEKYGRDTQEEEKKALELTQQDREYDREKARKERAWQERQQHNEREAAFQKADKARQLEIEAEQQKLREACQALEENAHTEEEKKAMYQAWKKRRKKRYARKKEQKRLAKAFKAEQAQRKKDFEEAEKIIRQKEEEEEKQIAEKNKREK